MRPICHGKYKIKLIRTYPCKADELVGCLVYDGSGDGLGAFEEEEVLLFLVLAGPHGGCLGHGSGGGQDVGEKLRHHGRIGKDLVHLGKGKRRENEGWCQTRIPA